MNKIFMEHTPFFFGSVLHNMVIMHKKHIFILSIARGQLRLGIKETTENVLFEQIQGRALKKVKIVRPLKSPFRRFEEAAMAPHVARLLRETHS
ncbi:hypothetical protein LQ50_19635 [Halalkalibacter okhensis]|uniref:Uncharacterized protein n=1 Tax=Halalkalibacter okhensis TaxID=333138 RepID=A0A0B0IBL3_9BACI|nr:hypothetical protein LQ50_19635 [Halalkalibacter okhensis]